MRIDKIYEARKEAIRFIRKIRKLEQEMVNMGTDGLLYKIIHTKESAAVKRSSMDLTRALSEMRNAR